MTLVVGIRFGARFQIQSDSLITHRDAVRPNTVPGRLKSVVLHPLLCVSFAGSADVGIDAVRNLGVTPDSQFDPQHVLDSLKESHDRSRDSVDFLVCSLAQESGFTKISGGTVAQGGDRYWIGDPDAVNEFQARFEATQPPQGAPEEFADLSRSLQAFNSLLREHSLPTVGGFGFRAASSESGFRYMEGATAFYPSQSIPSGISTTLKFGGPAHGGFAYSVLVPAQPGQPALGVHLFQGRLGYLYLPLERDDAVEYTDVSHEEFRRRVLADHAVDINGPRVG